MSYTTKGIVFYVGPTEQVTDSFKKREIILKDETNAQYPQFIKFECTQDRVALLDNIFPNMFVQIDWNLNGKSWTDNAGQTKYFNSLNPWKVTVVQAGVPPQGQPQGYPQHYQQPGVPQGYPQQGYTQQQQAPAPNYGQPQQQQQYPQQQQYQQQQYPQAAPAPQQQVPNMAPSPQQQQMPFGGNQQNPMANQVPPPLQGQYKDDGLPF